MTDRMQTLGAAVEHLKAGRYRETAALCAPVVASAPGDLDARLLLALSLGELGQTDDAIAHLSAIAEARPGHEDAHRELARLLRLAGRRDEAELHYRAAVIATPRDALTICDLGRFYNEEGRYDEAVAQARAALKIAPHLSPARNLLGVALAGQGETAEAVATLEKAAELDPKSVGALANLGTALATEGRFAESIAASDRALALAPQDVIIRMNRAMALLKAGRLREGWAEYEWRLKKPGREKLPPHLKLPRLTDLPGGVAGKRIVAYHEEGFGDTIQFLRYLPLLAEAGAEVHLWVPEPLVRLAQRIEGIAGVLTGDVNLPAFDYHCPIISLPYVFDTVLETIPADVPYLDADPDPVRGWSERLPPAAFRVGLVWAGEPRPYDLAAVALDRRRSVPLSALAALGQVPGIQLVSLQTGAAAAQTGVALYDPMGGVTDFADTAAIVANLDLVVSVDTAAAHLAGAMGKPVFLLDRYDNCWRWLAGRSDSPWYPTMRIFRQARMGDWGRAVDHAVAALTRMARG